MTGKTYKEPLLRLEILLILSFCAMTQVILLISHSRLAKFDSIFPSRISLVSSLMHDLQNRR